MNELQEVLFEMLQEVDRVCRKNDITYYLVYGSALGAVRHKGFIPWDDDMDLAVHRKDKEKFENAMKNDLDIERFFYQSIETDPGYQDESTKVRRNGTAFILEWDYRNCVGVHRGVFIDIFWIDNLQDGEFSRIICSVIVLARSLLVGLIQVTFPQSRIMKFCTQQTIRILEKMSSAREGKMSVIRFTFCYKECIPKDWYGTPQMVEFEGLTVPIPEKTDAYLTKVYGNYMKIPDKKHQITHNSAFLDLHNGYQKYIPKKKRR